MAALHLAPGPLNSPESCCCSCFKVVGEINSCMTRLVGAGLRGELGFTVSWASMTATPTPHPPTSAGLNPGHLQTAPASPSHRKSCLGSSLAGFFLRHFLRLPIVLWRVCGCMHTHLLISFPQPHCDLKRELCLSLKNRSIALSPEASCGC